MRALPSSRRLISFAVLLPAAVAGSNQLLFELAPSFRGPQWWLYPWMAFSTAVLSWCTGRYLAPVWLRWLVFGWSLVLLDFLTIAACMSYRVDPHFGYALVSAQVGMLVMWGLLANTNWQWRLPAVLTAAAAVIVFSGSFYYVSGRSSARPMRDWNLLMIASAVIVALLCGTLRFRNFVLQGASRDESASDQRPVLGTHQFGIKHMLLWSAALVPILLVARGLDFVLFKRLGAPLLFPFVVFAIGVAAVNLLAIWAVLGQGRIVLRLAAVLAIPLLLAYGVGRYLDYVESTRRVVWTSASGYSYFTHTKDWDDSIIGSIFDGRETLLSWFWLNAALLAALLLFLRARGHRLVRKSESM